MLKKFIKKLSLISLSVIIIALFMSPFNIYSGWCMDEDSPFFIPIMKQSTHEVSTILNGNLDVNQKKRGFQIAVEQCAPIIIPLFFNRLPKDFLSNTLNSHKQRLESIVTERDKEISRLNQFMLTDWSGHYGSREAQNQAATKEMATVRNGKNVLEGRIQILKKAVEDLQNIQDIVN